MHSGLSVDDLAVAARRLQAIIDILENTHGFKLKELDPSPSTWDATSTIIIME